jgi:hypothetical protein
MKRFLILLIPLIVGGLFLSPAFAADLPIIEPGYTMVPDDLYDLHIVRCNDLNNPLKPARYHLPHLCLCRGGMTLKQPRSNRKTVNRPNYPSL